MARPMSWAVLLCIALLLLSISHGFGRSGWYPESEFEEDQSMQEGFEKYEREMTTLLDYDETGPNVNGQAGLATPLPPPSSLAPPPSGDGHGRHHN